MYEAAGLGGSRSLSTPLIRRPAARTSSLYVLVLGVLSMDTNI